MHIGTLLRGRPFSLAHKSGFGRMRFTEDIMYKGDWVATGDVSEYDDYEIDEYDGVRLLEEGGSKKARS